MKTSTLLITSTNVSNANNLRHWTGVGEAVLLNQHLIGLICSRQCPGNILLETLDRAAGWAEERRIVLSGFHSPLEQQVLHSLLRRKGRAVKLLARGMSSYKAPTEEREALDEGRMLVLTPFPPEVRHTTRATALERNRLILSLASEIVVPHVSEGSPLAEIIAEHSSDAPVVRIQK